MVLFGNCSPFPRVSIYCLYTVHSYEFHGPVFCYVCACISWVVLLLRSFFRVWEEGICGISVFNLVFLLFEEKSLKYLYSICTFCIGLYILVQVRREDSLGELCLQIIENERRVFIRPCVLYIQIRQYCSDFYVS